MSGEDFCLFGGVVSFLEDGIWWFFDVDVFRSHVNSMKCICVKLNNLIQIK